VPRQAIGNMRDFAIVPIIRAHGGPLGRAMGRAIDHAMGRAFTRRHARIAVQPAPPHWPARTGQGGIDPCILITRRATPGESPARHVPFRNSPEACPKGCPKGCSAPVMKPGRLVRRGAAGRQGRRAPARLRRHGPRGVQGPSPWPASP
jgi:hypothetical protein